MRDPWEAYTPRSSNRRRDPLDPGANVLRVDGDMICPRCLRFIAGHDIVRRTAYGVVQHEHCPSADGPLAEAASGSRELPFA